MKMLSGTAPSWSDKTTLAYVNHKAVPVDDAELSTHAKATSLFLKDWTGVNVIVMGGTDDSAAEASAYEQALAALPPQVLPRNAEGLPVGLHLNSSQRNPAPTARQLALCISLTGLTGPDGRASCGQTLL